MIDPFLGMLQHMASKAFINVKGDKNWFSSLSLILCPTPKAKQKTIMQTIQKLQMGFK